MPGAVAKAAKAALKAAAAAAAGAVGTAAAASGAVASGVAAAACSAAGAAAGEAADVVADMAIDAAIDAPIGAAVGAAIGAAVGAAIDAATGAAVGVAALPTALAALAGPSPPNRTVQLCAARGEEAPERYSCRYELCSSAWSRESRGARRPAAARMEGAVHGAAAERRRWLELPPSPAGDPSGEAKRTCTVGVRGLVEAGVAS